MKSIRANMFAGSLLAVTLGFSTDALSAPNFVPNVRQFWDSSENWTTEFGPAYRDTVERPENLVPCTGDYALCFHSGPEPLPCKLTKAGRYADCECTVEHGLNFVLISAILNYRVYLETVAVCGRDGSGCTVPDTAPVCAAIRDGKLIPGAGLISTYSPDAQGEIGDTLANGPLTVCPKGPYAACMTAPCEITKAGDAECSCPVFWGSFQLTESDANCDLGDDLVWSSSFSPPLLFP